LADTHILLHIGRGLRVRRMVVFFSHGCAKHRRGAGYSASKFESRGKRRFAEIEPNAVWGGSKADTQKGEPARRLDVGRWQRRMEERDETRRDWGGGEDGADSKYYSTTRQTGKRSKQKSHYFQRDFQVAWPASVYEHPKNRTHNQPVPTVEHSNPAPGSKGMRSSHILRADGQNFSRLMICLRRRSVHFLGKSVEHGPPPTEGRRCVRSAPS
jgi:hypothetical protein